MVNLMTCIFKKILRWAIYLAITGELVSCTIYMRQKAYKSVSGGLISLQYINGGFGGLNR